MNRLKPLERGEFSARIEFDEVILQKICGIVTERVIKHLEENKQKEDTKKLLNVSQAADYLQISRTTIYRHINEGILSPYNFRGRLMFSVEQLKEYSEGVK